MEGTHYKNKYRVESIRLSGYDYARPGYYFVTICVDNRIWCFGNVKNQKMQLSDLGKSAYKCWLEIPEHFPFVETDEFVIMPNHTHGIIKIMQNKNMLVETQDFASQSSRNTKNNGRASNGRMNGMCMALGKETQDIASLQGDGGFNKCVGGLTRNISSKKCVGALDRNFKNNFGPQSNNLSSIIRGYKIGVTKFAKNNNIKFKWQERFYESVIWTDDALNRVRQYIANNPRKWDIEKNNKENLYM